MTDFNTPLLTARRSIGACLLLAVALLCFGCATAGTSGSNASGAASKSSGSNLFDVPSGWRLVDQQDSGRVYQAKLENRTGPGRILMGRLLIERDVGDLSAYLGTVHKSLVDRLKGSADLAPYVEDNLEWTNGMIGMKTLLRGAVQNRGVIISGLTFSDGENAYFLYGVFPEDEYQQGQQDYSRMLSSLAPLEGVSRVKNNLKVASVENKVASVDEQRGPGGPATTATGGETAAPDRDASDRSSLVGNPHSHFREFKWGATKSDIRRVEGDPVKESGNALVYRCKLFGFDDCLLVYMFTLGQLTHGAYIIDDQYDDANQYIKDYLDTGKRLISTYDKPRQNAAIWSVTKFRDQRNRWGKALLMGHVVFGGVWEMGDDVKLIHSLKADYEGGVLHRIIVKNGSLRERLQQRARARR